MADVSLDAAKHLDQSSAFQYPADSFQIPMDAEGSATPYNAYLVGHSFGLQSRHSAALVAECMESWEKRGVRGHFKGPHQWMPYHEEGRNAVAMLAGGEPDECALMGSLTSNVHVMLATFFRPEGDRREILMEGGAFPSDRYAIRSHVAQRGLEPKSVINEVKPRGDSFVIETDDVLEVLESRGDKIALVFLGAVQFISGQVLDIERITKAAHAKGCMVGFDLAHAMGNIPLDLHRIGPDFAVFCGYKYLNGGPGNGAGIWVNSKHVKNPDLVHPAGWWGNDPETRFQMREEFEPRLTADRFVTSNPPIASLAAARGGLRAFEEAAELNGGNLDALWARREQLWEFLLETVKAIHVNMPTVFSIITPEKKGEHGAMLSLLVRGKAPEVESALEQAGFAVDARGQDIIRISASPFWGSAEQIHSFGIALREVLAAVAT